MQVDGLLRFHLIHGVSGTPEALHWCEVKHFIQCEIESGIIHVVHGPLLKTSLLVTASREDASKISHYYSLILGLSMEPFVAVFFSQVALVGYLT